MSVKVCEAGGLVDDASSVADVIAYSIVIHSVILYLIKGLRAKKCPYFTVLAYHVPPWACLRCLKGSVGSSWPSIHVVKSWLYGVDLLLSGSELRRSLERSAD